MNSAAHTHANTQMAPNGSFASLTPKAPVPPPDDRFMLKWRVLSPDQVTSSVQNLWEAWYDSLYQPRTPPITIKDKETTKSTQGMRLFVLQKKIEGKKGLLRDTRNIWMHLQPLRQGPELISCFTQNADEARFLHLLFPSDSPNSNSQTQCFPNWKTKWVTGPERGVTMCVPLSTFPTLLWPNWTTLCSYLFLALRLLIRMCVLVETKPSNQCQPSDSFA